MLQSLVSALARDVDNSHTEASRAARHRLAYCTPSDDPQRGAPNVTSEHQFWRPRAPFAGSYELVAFNHAPRHGHHQSKSEIRGGFGQDAGSMTDCNSRAGRGRK